MDCSVLLLRHLYSAGSACVLLNNNCMSCPSIRATLSALLINTSGFLPVVLARIASLWGWNNPVQEAVSASRGGCIIHAGGGGGFTHWRTDCFDVQPTTTSGNIITQSIIFSFSISLTFVYFASSAATSRWRICMSVIAAFASFSSLAFCRAGLCR